MFAVIRTGGKQYRVTEGRYVDIEKLSADVGAQVEFDDVLLIENGSTALIGAPRVPGARVVGKILRQDKAKKVIVFKFRRRKNYRRKNGHRQPFTRVMIEKIVAGGQASPPVFSKQAPPPPPAA